MNRLKSAFEQFLQLFKATENPEETGLPPEEQSSYDWSLADETSPNSRSESKKKTSLLAALPFDQNPLDPLPIL